MDIDQWRQKNLEVEQNILDILSSPTLTLSRSPVRESAPTVKFSQKQLSKLKISEKRLSESQNEVHELKRQLRAKSDLEEREPISKFDTFEELKVLSQPHSAGVDEIYWKSRYDHLNDEVGYLKAELKRCRESLLFETNLASGITSDLRSSQDRSKRSDDVILGLSCEKVKLERAMEDERILHLNSHQTLNKRILDTEERLIVSNENSTRIRLLQETCQQETLRMHVKCRNLSIGFGLSKLSNLFSKKQQYAISLSFSHWKTICACQFLHTINTRRTALDRRNYDHHSSQLTDEFQARIKLIQSNNDRMTRGYESLLQRSYRSKFKSRCAFKALVKWLLNCIRSKSVKLSSATHQYTMLSVDKSELVNKISVLRAQVDSSMHAVATHSDSVRNIQKSLNHQTGNNMVMAGLLLKCLSGNCKRFVMKSSWGKWKTQVSLLRYSDKQDRANYAVTILRSRIYRISSRYQLSKCFLTWRTGYWFNQYQKHRLDDDVVDQDQKHILDDDVDDKVDVALIEDDDDDDVQSPPPLIMPVTNTITNTTSSSALLTQATSITMPSPSSIRTKLFSIRHHLASSVYCLSESIYQVMHSDNDDVLSLPLSSHITSSLYQLFIKQTGPTSPLRSYLSLVTHTLKQFVSLKGNLLTNEELRIIVKSLASDVMTNWDDWRTNDIRPSVGGSNNHHHVKDFLSIISHHNPDNDIDDMDTESSVACVRKILPVMSSSSLDTGAGPKEFWSIVSPSSSIVQGKLVSQSWSAQLHVEDVVEHIKRIALLVHDKIKYPTLSLGRTQKHRKMADLRMYQLILIGTFEQSL